MTADRIAALGRLACAVLLAWCLPWAGLGAAEPEALTWQFSATTDFLANVRGGISRGLATPTSLDWLVNLDTEAAGAWSGGEFGLYLLGTVGGDPSRHVGDIQFSSSLEAQDSLRLFEAWYRHRFADDHAELLLGLREVNFDFYALEHAALFVNSSFGLGLEVTQDNLSTFPISAPGVRLKLMPDDLHYVQVAGYDGIPGDPDDPYGTHIKFDEGDGVFSIIEAGRVQRKERYSKLAVGAWSNTAAFEDAAGVPRQGDWGAYAVAEYDVIRSAESGRGIGVFAQAGYADSDRNRTDLYLGGGLQWVGLFPSRPQDVLGIAVARVRSSTLWRATSPETEAAETAVELTWKLQPLPWLMFQPDLQYVFDPGTDPLLDDALVIGARVRITL